MAKKKSDPWVALQADLDQDYAEADAWWLNASDEDLKKTWDFIQRDFSKNPVADVVSRMAQNEFTRLALKHYRARATEELAARLAEVIGPCSVCGKAVGPHDLMCEIDGKFLHVACKPKDAST